MLHSCCEFVCLQFCLFFNSVCQCLKCSSISVVNGTVRGTKDHVVGEEKTGGGGGSREECD